MVYEVEQIVIKYRDGSQKIIKGGDLVEMEMIGLHDDRVESLVKIKYIGEKELMTPGDN